MIFKPKQQLFNISEDVIYLNTASFSPAFKSVETAGIEAIKQKSHPELRQGSDLFNPVIDLRKLFAKVIDEDDYNRVVTIPSVSYGMANVANNITLNSGDEILIVEEQFPSNYYIWEDVAKRYDTKIVTIKQPDNPEDWNSAILKKINSKTALVAIGHIHWANGLLFDLKAIRNKTSENNSLLVIDGSQSIGALPFSIKDIQPDALVCAGYKWLFGPYGCAYAYYGPYFDGGKPIEQNWANRLGSENLSGLTTYQSEYKSKASRYAMGESGSFIYVKMQIAALTEILKINRQEFQEYCHLISEKSLVKLSELGFTSNTPNIRAKHLFGIKIPNSVDVDKLKEVLKSNNIHLSFRGKYMRVSCHVFNAEKHFNKLYNVINSVVNG
ncbi:MAG: aminotransferase class V-fold PLP-dependent enzyme [Winogradskyella sp.]|uniref:aminotransferase class V-fold PLP-dependent enzyme n=1 Tax=Winogradskyella sp. TaxID=1883156 RepID=UPI0017DB0A4B|nr:aminotransferase class V-fold PLP-dependent enzyme [Winogradskyella sp.]MBT8244720.1 aminotransferase class V-fold PLP-dependent enzyme [Winogradskyella sp.]NNK22800.1 aminotransferase class V-fold PLP-dependent enzyme [Winogradskyella sp.]